MNTVENDSKIGIVELAEQYMNEKKRLEKTTAEHCPMLCRSNLSSGHQSKDHTSTTVAVKTEPVDEKFKMENPNEIFGEENSIGIKKLIGSAPQYPTMLVRPSHNTDDFISGKTILKQEDEPVLWDSNKCKSCSSEEESMNSQYVTDLKDMRVSHQDSQKQTEEKLDSVEMNSQKLSTHAESVKPQNTRVTRRKTSQTTKHVKSFSNSLESCPTNRSEQILDTVKQVRKEKPRKISCPVCDKKLLWISHLKDHMMCHSDERPFACSVCNEKFSRQSTLKQHFKIHTGEKTHCCSYCGEKFNQRYRLMQHERIHTGEKPFGCSYCDAKFRLKNFAKQHERTHTGEKPFACPHCPARFDTQNHMKCHVTTHTGDKPFVCPDCDARFCLQYRLERHLATHCKNKPYRCSYCSAKFNVEEYLQRHEKSHMGVGDYVCQFCAKQFMLVRDLNKHLNEHKEENLEAQQCTP